LSRLSLVHDLQPFPTRRSSDLIYDYLRILLARLGQLHCPQCENPVGTQTADQVVDSVLAEPAGSRLYLMAPVEIDVGQQYTALRSEEHTSELQSPYDIVCRPLL